MFTTASMTVLGAGLLLAAITGLWAYLRRPAAQWHIIAAVVLQVAVLGQSVVAWFRTPGAGLGEAVTFIAYSIGILVPLPVGIWAAKVERTRWGSTALAFTCLVVAVMTLRLYQLWRVHV